MVWRPVAEIVVEQSVLYSRGLKSGLPFSLKPAVMEVLKEAPVMEADNQREEPIPKSRSCCFHLFN